MIIFKVLRKVDIVFKTLSQISHLLVKFLFENIAIKQFILKIFKFRILLTHFFFQIKFPALKFNCDNSSQNTDQSMTKQFI